MVVGLRWAIAPTLPFISELYRFCMAKPFLFHLGEERHELLKQLATQTQVSMAELLRRILDHGLTPANLNQEFPNYSGRLGSVGGR